MGDENSQAGVTKAHKHTSVSTDGGFLDANSITGFSNTNAGSILYMDGSNQATNLDVGNTGDTLTVSGSSLPEWAGAGATGSYQFIEKFTLGADAQYFDCTLATPYVYNDYDHLILQLSLQASVTTNGQALVCRYANSGTSYHTGDYMHIMSFLSDSTGVVKQYYSVNDCIVLQPDSGTVGSGVSDNQWVTSNLAFYNSGSSGTHKNKPFKNWTINTNLPEGNDGFGFHEDGTNRTELTSFRFAFCQDDFTFPAGTFEIQADSSCTCWRVANS